jgi:transmembrane sensor
MTADFSSGSVSQAGSPDWDAIGRFLAGESSPAEAAAVRAWLDANPRDRDLLERLDAVAAQQTASDVDVESALALVHARMHERVRDDGTGAVDLRVVRGGSTKHAGSSRRGRYVLVGSVVAAAAAATAVFVVNSRSSSQPKAAGHTYATTTGQRDSVMLADGSRVTLGPRTTLVVPADYAARRAVQLTGDAFFDVRHDASHPFSVRIGSAVIEDVGTSFSVESDAGDAASVAVVTGRVRLRGADSSPNSGVVLAAGDRGDIDASGRTRVARSVVGGDDIAWTAGRLVFRDAPLSRVAAELQRWYGVTLQADDSILYQRHVTTQFSGESIDTVLQILGLAIDARVDRKGDTATIHSTRGASGAR